MINKPASKFRCALVASFVISLSCPWQPDAGASTAIFQLDSGSGSISGNVFESTLIGLEEAGVVFNATITVTGSGDLTQSGGGLGVDVDSSDLVSNGEFLQFSLTTEAVSGGSVSFDGFTELDFNNLGSSDSAVLSFDSTVGDDFFTTSTGAGDVDFSGLSPAVSPTLFYAIALPEGSGSNSFRIDDVTASFSVVAAIPEPTAFAFGGLVASCMAGLVVARHRNRVRNTAA